MFANSCFNKKVVCWERGGGEGGGGYSFNKRKGKGGGGVVSCDKSFGS